MLIAWATVWHLLLVVLAWRASHLPDLVRRCGGDDRTSTNGGTGADSETQRWTRSKTFIQRRIAFVFVAPQKTEGMAIAILAALFGDNPNVGALTLPIVSYHTVQMLVAAILVPRVRAHATCCVSPSLRWHAQSQRCSMTF